MNEWRFPRQFFRDRNTDVTQGLPCHSVDSDAPADCPDYDVSVCVVTSLTTSRSVCRTQRTCTAVESVPGDAAATTTTAAADLRGHSVMSETFWRGFVTVMMSRRGFVDDASGRRWRRTRRTCSRLSRPPGTHSSDAVHRTSTKRRHRRRSFLSTLQFQRWLLDCSQLVQRPPPSTTTTTWTTADSAAGWTTVQLDDAEPEHGTLGDQQTDESRMRRQAAEKVMAAVHIGTDRLQSGNRWTGMAGVDDGKPAVDLQSETPVNMAKRNDHHSEIIYLQYVCSSHVFFTQAIYFT